MDNRQNQNNGSNNQPPRRPGLGVILVAMFGSLLLVMLFSGLLLGGSRQDEQEYSRFLQDLKEDKVESVLANYEKALLSVTLKYDKNSKENQVDPFTAAFLERYGSQVSLKGETYTTRMMEDMTTLTARLEEKGIKAQRVVSDSRWMDILLTIVLPLVLIWILMGFMFRKMNGAGGPLGVGKSNAKVYVQKETGVTFKDVAGEDEAKESLVEVVDFLHDPGKYTKIGAKLPKGALLVGPPGTGKTLLAKAVAGEAKVPFFSLTGSDFIEMYVGVGASRVRDLFREATKNAPCIVFIDEIDAIGRSRDSKYGGGNEEREQTLNQLLSEMDGFDSSKGVLILAATNRPEILDKALLRPGRFDRRIIVDKPDLKGRVEILKVHSKDVKMDESVDLDAIALATSGAVGSDLANMINEAAINAVKEKREFVNQQDLFNAVEVVLVGKEKKDRIMSKEERRIVSYHEVGHALISALQKNSEPVQKITIVPRTMGALGYVMQMPEEEKYLNTEEELRDMLVGLVGGRAAEEIVFGNVTTGAANDIERATAIARNMVTRFGMSKRFGLIGLATVESQYLEGRTALNCSDKTAADIDEEVMVILKDSYEKALAMLRENRDVMDKLADFLIEKETITGKEFMRIFREAKGLPEPEEKPSGNGEKPEEKKPEEKKAEEKTDGDKPAAQSGFSGFINVTVTDETVLQGERQACAPDVLGTAGHQSEAGGDAAAGGNASENNLSGDNPSEDNLSEDNPSEVNLSGDNRSEDNLHPSEDNPPEDDGHMRGLFSNSQID